MREQGPSGGFSIGAADGNEVEVRKALPMVSGFFLEEGKGGFVTEDFFWGQMGGISRGDDDCGGSFFQG